MKKLLFLLFSLSLITIACTKDEEPAKPIDKFIGNFEGNLYEYKCEGYVLYNTYENTKVEIIKENETDLNGTLNNEDGNKIFSFSGRLNSDNDNKFSSSTFLYDNDTLFANGEIIDGKLKISFGAFSCPAGTNTYTATREFKEQ